MIFFCRLIIFIFERLQVFFVSLDILQHEKDMSMRTLDIELGVIGHFQAGGSHELSILENG